MKKILTATGIVTLVSLVGTIIIMTLSPDTVPVHFNAVGEPDRFGSKFELLMFPGIVAFLGAAMAFETRRQAKRGKGGNERVFFISAVCIMALICGMGLFNGIRGIIGAGEGGANVTCNVVSIVCIIAGVALVVLGNIMPKAQMNGMFGLRTPWSMKNDHVWQQCQRFAGITTVICGVLLLFLPVVLPETWLLWGILGLIVLWGVASFVASYVIYKGDAERN